MPCGYRVLVQNGNLLYDDQGINVHFNVSYPDHGELYTALCDVQYRFPPMLQNLPFVHVLVSIDAGLCTILKKLSGIFVSPGFMCTLKRGMFHSTKDRPAIMRNTSDSAVCEWWKHGYRQRRGNKPHVERHVFSSHMPTLEWHKNGRVARIESSV